MLDPVGDMHEGDVVCYSTSKEKLLQVFQESGVLAWKEGKCQRIKGCSARVALTVAAMQVTLEMQGLNCIKIFFYLSLSVCV